MTLAYLRETQQRRSKRESRAETEIFTHPILSSDNLQTVLKCSPQHFLLVEIRLARVMMIISIAISSLGALVAIFGLRCTRCLDENKQSKDRAAFTGGILSVCSGLSALGITSWFMYGIVDDFFQEDNQNRYVIGRSLIGAFVASLLCLFGGVSLCACSVTHLRSNKNLSKLSASKIPGKDYV
ncbi:unnamed protein product [Leuciscus chuanchicus]